MTGRRTNTRPCGTPGCTQPRGHLGLCTEESLPRVEDEAEVHGTTDTCATVADHSAAPSARGSVGGLGVASTRTRRGISQPRQQVTSLVATLLDPRNELTRFFCDQVEDRAKCRLVQTAHVVREIVVTMQPEVHTEGCAQSLTLRRLRDLAAAWTVRGVSARGPRWTRLDALVAACPHLETLELYECPKLTSLTGLGESAVRRLRVTFSIFSSGVGRLTSLDGLPSTLTHLAVTNCRLPASLHALPRALVSLALDRCDGVGSLDGLPSTMTDLSLGGCRNLVYSLDDLPRALLRLSLSERADDLPDGSGLASLRGLPSTLSHLELCGFGGLTSFEGIPNALSSLSLCHCEGFTTLDGLSDSLQHLHLVDCHGLTDLAGLPARLLRLEVPLYADMGLSDLIVPAATAVGLRLPPPPASALSSVGAEASAHDLGVWVRPRRLVLIPDGADAPLRKPVHVYPGDTVGDVVRREWPAGDARLHAGRHGPRLDETTPLAAVAEGVQIWKM